METEKIVIPPERAWGYLLKGMVQEKSTKDFTIRRMSSEKVARDSHEALQLIYNKLIIQ